MAQNLEFNKEMDTCALCGGTDFALDENRWERSCTFCGCCGPLSWSIPVIYDFKRKTYTKKGYFLTHTVAAAILAGAKIDRHDMEILGALHAKCVDRFHATQHEHKRKSFLHSGFILYKLGLYLGTDFEPFIKMPVLGATRRRLDGDWELYINPWKNE